MRACGECVCVRVVSVCYVYASQWLDMFILISHPKIIAITREYYSFRIIFTTSKILIAMAKANTTIIELMIVTSICLQFAKSVTKLLHRLVLYHCRL